MEEIKDTVFIGNAKFPKLPMQYAEEVARIIAFKDKKEVKILARGRFISNAVDVEEIVRNRLLEGKNAVKIKSVTLGTEQKDGERDGKKFKKNISTIEIILEKI